MSVYADLHVHTTHSDGKFELEDIPSTARDAGVSVVAITDHDSIHPELSGRVTNVDGVTIIRSIELRVDVPELGERVDLLGYGVEQTPELMNEINRLQTDRATRAQRIIEGVEEELDISLALDGREGMGRPHIARAIVDHKDTQYDDPQPVFDEVIGNGRPAYVARDVTDFETGVRLLNEACAIVGLAHPFRYDDPEGAIRVTSHLDAIEGPYPYGNYADVDPMADGSPVLAALDDHERILTGGTDAHGVTLGKAGLTKKEFQPLEYALGL